MKETAILINVRDRPTELSLLLQSLRTQTYKDFDIFILDDQSGTQLQSYHFFNCMLTRLIQEDFSVKIKRTDFPHGVSKARQNIVDWAREFDYKYLCRVDDDVILEPDYLERLKKVIESGYDLASGVTVPMTNPTPKRDPKFLKGVINRIVLDEEGNYVFCGDDCGMQYLRSEILPAHHFRSCALYKSEIHDKANYTPTKLTKHGFREEQIFSYKLQLAGYKIGVDTGAINYHQLTPSGGERFPDQGALVPQNQKILLEYTKEHKKELRKLFPDFKFTPQELMKQTNLK